MGRFDYLAEKIANAPFATEPFKHIYITDFLEPQDFAAIVGSPEIDLPKVEDDDALFDTLYANGYKMIEFPGCITDRQDYIDWHKTGRTKRYYSSACEGFGVTLRLFEPTTPVLKDLIEFLSSKRFNRALADKFGLDFSNCNADNGIQKYLDGYEISPHPDIRRKAATFMVNINPHAGSETLDHHTHYMQLKPEYRRVREFWDKHSDTERCWVPWDWCETVKTQPENNSIVLFAPENDTMHAVRAHYDHLSGQRTQLYGNLWHKDVGDLPPHDWELFELERGNLNWGGIKQKLRKSLPDPVLALVRKAKADGKAKQAALSEIGERNY